MSISVPIDPTVARVYITDALKTRNPHQVDHIKEKMAFLELASRMVHAPHEVLPRFVQLAMEIAQATSAGLSLCKRNPAPGVFRWTHLHGVLLKLENTTPPCSFSPCGVALDSGAPVLAAHPEEVYDWMRAANVQIPELLLVPIYKSGTSIGTLWVASHETGHFDMSHVRSLVELVSFLDVALSSIETREHQNMLLRELDHRVKNAFAVAEALVRLTLMSAASPEQMAQALIGRLRALANANSLIGTEISGTEAVRKVAALAELINITIRPHQFAGDGLKKITLEGPPVFCGDRSATSIAVIIHELATNATKYGALRTDKGRLAIKWTVDGENAVLCWVETSGTPVNPPVRTGFGSQLIQSMVRQLLGTIDMHWRSSGLALTIVLPLKSLAPVRFSSEPSGFG